MMEHMIDDVLIACAMSEQFQANIKTAVEDAVRAIVSRYQGREDYGPVLDDISCPGSSACKTNSWPKPDPPTRSDADVAQAQIREQIDACVVASAVKEKAMETKSFDVSCDTQPQGKFVARLCRWNQPDGVGDVLRQGTFLDSIERWQKKSRVVPVVFNHKWDDIIEHVGEIKPDDMYETAEGLEVHGSFYLNEPTALEGVPANCTQSDL